MVIRDAPPDAPQRLRTGVDGLDSILHGGLVARRCYLVRGGPGMGKTTLGFHYLSEGIKAGERVMFITLGEGERDLRQNARAVGLDTEGIEFLDLSPSSDFFTTRATFDLFTPAQVDHGTITQRIMDRVKAVKPHRIFFDSTSHLRYLSLDAHSFRRQLLSFVRFLIEQDVTLLFTSESTTAAPDDDVMYLSDGIIELKQNDVHRSIEVTKLRGSASLGGPHAMRLTSNGMRVFVTMRFLPDVVQEQHTIIKTGIDAIDTLLGGGIETGSVTLLTGPAGVGKTTLGAQFVYAALQNDVRCVIFQFEESQSSLLYRTKVLGFPLATGLDSGNLRIVPVDLSAVSEDEVADRLREEVENFGAQIIMFDSISGYSLCLGRSQSFLPLRNLFQFLKSRNVTTIAINETQTVTGEFRPTEIGISFMADNIVFLRFLELDGAMCKAIGVLKKRMSDFERYLREFSITPRGIEVGAPMTGLRGILNGIPEWVQGAPKTTPTVRPSSA